MLFSDPIFLFVFLPLAILFFYIVPKKLKNVILLLFSLAFYTWGERKMVLLLLISAMVDFLAGILILKKYKKTGLYFSIIFNLGILIYFKYSNFILENVYTVVRFWNKNIELNTLNVMMPLGISFFTFQTMSYTIDVYRGKVKATYSFINFCTYVSLFPQLVAGPIVRYEDVEDQLVHKNLTISKFATGAERFVKGLFKKIFIANNLALLADIAFETPSGYGTLFSWMGIFCYTLYTYYDVSGYTDMAIGLGKIFGFDFPENFDYPYLASSIRDFWRKWHITMSTWFRDYIYISLGGNKVSSSRVLLNLAIVFLVTGLWHGAAWNFVVWGLWHGIFIVLEKKIHFKKMPKPLKHIYVMLVVMIGLVIFRANSLNHSIVYLKQLFYYKPIYDQHLLDYAIRLETIVSFVLAVLFSFPIYRYLKNQIALKIKESTFLVLRTIIMIVMLLVSYTYIAIGAYNPFIYFRF